MGVLRERQRARGIGDAAQDTGPCPGDVPVVVGTLLPQYAGQVETPRDLLQQ